MSMQTKDPAVARTSVSSAAPPALGLASRLFRDRWMFVPIGLLTVTVAISVATVTLAVAGHPLGAEPDYYAKAAQWDAHRAQLAANDALRWNVAPEIVPSSAGTPILTIEIRDKYSGLIDADAAEVEAIPIASADLREQGSMTRTDTGRFQRELNARIPGQWEFRVTVRKGDSIYTDTFRRTLSFARRTGKTTP
jgi:FixH